VLLFALLEQEDDLFRKVRGFRDIYGKEARYWQKMEKICSEILASFGYKEFKLPVLEKAEVFNKGIGDTTDIVEKEMFSFTDRDGSVVSLRPEGTASLVRSYVENKLYSVPNVAKYYYFGPMFRRERPQKGRFRQFYQLGIEVFGTPSPIVDADVIYLLQLIAEKCEIGDIVQMEINSIGCKECRPAYNKALVDYFTEKKEVLCEDCLRRLERNPMRILDCKNENCKSIVGDAPVGLDYLCGECEEHFDEVKKRLDIYGVDYKINPRMVRGLDYYVRTAYELVTDQLGSQSAVGAGGRYDGLVELMGGPDIPGIGFAIGVDRLVSLMMLDESLKDTDTDVFVISFRGDSSIAAQKLMNEFRMTGIRAEMDYDLKAMKKQMKKADTMDSRFTIILGDDELKDGVGSVKNMETGNQEKIDLDKIVNYVKERIN